MAFHLKDLHLVTSGGVCLSVAEHWLLQSDQDIRHHDADADHDDADAGHDDSPGT